MSYSVNTTLLILWIIFVVALADPEEFGRAARQWVDEFKHGYETETIEEERFQ